MTDNGGNDRRRDIEGRINTLGTGSNGVGGRRADSAEEEADDAEPETGVTPEADDDRGSDEAATERETGVTPEADSDDSGATADDADRETGVTPEASTDDHGGEEEDRSSLDIELDRFVRAFAVRRAEESDETLDEYVVGSVKGYLAGLLGGDVESPGTLKRRVDVEADDVFGGLLDAVADEEQDRGDVVVAAVAEAYDVPEEDELSVAGLRDHEAMLNGVVANSSNSLGEISEVVQAAVETRLIEERRE
ncbi:hypothetical protein B4589_002990 [Halolamina sp. CBA1230]|uniref:hypothetical protein n=1 Tax=Halolamina sp. CBA1230 TaxID=1853690 RepID=UPI0009A1C4A0|nr:hypothetical protein [Halolamina sp. CBA1230]QKY19392.1 hypothetical protein B4589_002990 [Halolamina sp. CBA1230]